MSINESSKNLLRAIENGLQNGEFKMYLQFIVDNKTKGIVSAEALSRWETEEGVVSPGKYIRAMEDSGLITVLDYQMFENACRKLSEWARTERDAISISCNFTRITISDADFANKIKEIADRYTFERHKLIVEITEDSMERNFEAAKENIVAAKALGFTVALDDVGNGYTPLRNLCDYPIDVVKLDRALLLLTDTERGRKLFYGIISLMHSLELTLVCEGVETEEQNEFVSASECDLIQGWYYSTALPEVEAEAFACAYTNRI